MVLNAAVDASSDTTVQSLVRRTRQPPGGRRSNEPRHSATTYFRRIASSAVEQWLTMPRDLQADAVLSAQAIHSQASSPHVDSILR